MPTDRTNRRSALPSASLPVRLRRLRRTAALRDWVAETEIELRRLVYPVFVRPGQGDPLSVPSMPAVEQHTVDSLGGLVRDLEKNGIRSVLVFGVARSKHSDGREAWAADGVVPQAVRRIRQPLRASWSPPTSVCARILPTVIAASFETAP